MQLLNSALSYTITGRRWAPSASSSDAEYRTRYRMTDTSDPTYDVTYEHVSNAVGQDGDQLDLINDVIQSTISLDGAKITSGGSPSYRGTVTPDRTAYVVEDHYIANGTDCVFALEIEGTARYR